MTIFGAPEADVLQQAVLSVASFRDCSRRNNPMSTMQVYENSMLCAGGHGKGGCKVKKKNTSHQANKFLNMNIWKSTN